MIGHSGVDHFGIGLVAALAIGAYGVAWLRQARRERWRLGCWIGGVVLVVVASSPALERLAEESFTGHMVQHLLVIVGAAPLLVLSRPLATATAAGWIPATALGRRIAAAWHRTGPVLGPALFVVVLFATHLTSIYDRALDDRLLHEAEHAAYLVGAVAMWAAVLGVGRSAAVARIGSVFGVIAGGALLGMILLSADGAPDADLRRPTRRRSGPRRPTPGRGPDVGHRDADDVAAAPAGRVAVGLDRGAHRPSRRGPRRCGYTVAALRRRSIGDHLATADRHGNGVSAIVVEHPVGAGGQRGEQGGGDRRAIALPDAGVHGGPDGPFGTEVELRAGRRRVQEHGQRPDVATDVERRRTAVDVVDRLQWTVRVGVRVGVVGMGVVGLSVVAHHGTDSGSTS